MLCRENIFEIFHEALEELQERGGLGRITPRAVAVRAHEIYCARTGPEGKGVPALVTFRKFVAGKTALPEIVALLETANVRPVSRVRVDRQRLRAAFQMAIQRLEARVLKGTVRPLHVARRAYEFYTDGQPDAVQKPSRHTFQKMLYGKAADPEVVSLLNPLFPSRSPSRARRRPV